MNLTLNESPLIRFFGTDMVNRRLTLPAFTVVELLVGLVIGALVLGAASMSISRMVSARTASVARQMAFSRAQAAAGRIALDLQAAARSSDLTFAKVAVTDGGPQPQSRDELLLLMTSHRPLRGIDGLPEGQLFESQYRVAPAPDGMSTLWRRVDTGFDLAVDGGGIATPAFRGVVSLSVQAYDNAAWFEEWDSDSDGLPHAIRVTVIATDDSSRVLATARRLIALDRVPVPPDTDEATDTSTDTATSGSTGSGS